MTNRFEMTREQVVCALSKRGICVSTFDETQECLKPNGAYSRERVLDWVLAFIGPFPT